MVHRERNKKEEEDTDCSAATHPSIVRGRAAAAAADDAAANITQLQAAAPERVQRQWSWMINDICSAPNDDRSCWAISLLHGATAVTKRLLARACMQYAG